VIDDAVRSHRERQEMAKRNRSMNTTLTT
jgi:hypothetical protein